VADDLAAAMDVLDVGGSTATLVADQEEVTYPIVTNNNAIH